MCACVCKETNSRQRERERDRETEKGNTERKKTNRRRRLEKQKKQKCDRELIKINARDDSKKEERAQKTREQKKVRTVISILPAGWPPISMSKNTTGLDIFYLYLFYFFTNARKVLCRPVGALLLLF